VRSLHLDKWNAQHKLNMIQGGNQRARHYFDEHLLSSVSPSERYSSKAADEYRQSLKNEVNHITSQLIQAGKIQATEPPKQTTNNNSNSQNIIILQRHSQSTSISSDDVFPEKKKKRRCCC